MSFWQCRIDDKECVLKVLRTREELSTGYQHHPVGPTDNEGFLFLFADELPERTFHMRNVKFNLDLLGFNNEGKLIFTTSMQANAEGVYKIPAGCKFIVEMQENWSNGINKNCHLSIIRH